MCMSKPKMPEYKPPAPPPATQEAKAPDIANVRRNKSSNAPIAGGTLLTGPSGVAAADVSATGGSLLGG